ncbi:MAG: c-type cytochrome biogenesis protein CcsB [Desulfobacca sp. 4484_104]|nr:MAG: c-type cytochrome biogenesis protein CcsB [Desulfobacca sp. 4484_104]RLA88617.1 MAG: c-type cytochrome biogenesis protein CcsB [Deltaproteobacteria bacterium]
METLILSVVLMSYFGATAIWLAYLLIQQERLYRYGVWVMGGGWMLHTLNLILAVMEQGYFPGASLGQALRLFSWTLVGTFLFLTWRHPIRVLGTLVAPLAALTLTGSLILPQPGPVAPLLQSLWLSFHIATALLGNATFTLAFMGGILYLVQEHQLKSKKFGFFYRRLPSLEALDALNYYCLTIGFPLLTAGIITGSIYAQYTLGSFWRWDPKETLTLIAWLIYAALLHERLAVGWRGRRAALMAIIGFLVLVVTFVGANLWLQGYHSFESFVRQP